MSRRIRIEAHGMTHPGKVRSVNQDQYLVADLQKSLLVKGTTLNLEERTRLLGGIQGELLVVADGMGGHAGGGRASRIAVDTLARYVLNTMPWFFRLDVSHPDELEQVLASALETCEAHIADAENRNPGTPDMGTTVTMAYLLWPRLYVVHAGDSRCYLHRGGELHRITIDHTLGQRLADRGLPVPRHAPRFVRTLWNVVGGTPKVRPDVYRAELELGDSLLLCTDGLTGHLGDGEIGMLLGGADTPEHACRRLIDAALERGGQDNVTVVVARAIQAPGPP
jgi:protein phosphatase